MTGGWPDEYGSRSPSLIFDIAGRSRTKRVSYARQSGATPGPATNLWAVSLSRGEVKLELALD
jgi:hypothetical protein